MTRLVSSLPAKLIAATLAGALVLPSVTPAEAGGGRKHWKNGGGHHQVHRPHRHRDQRVHRRHKKNDDLGAALAIGVIGLAAGAMLGSVLSAPQPVAPDPVYVPPHPHRYGPAYPAAQPHYRPAAPVVVGQQRPAPWTAEWYRYCDAKYRSFNPRTGTFTTYSGVQKLCR
ncbi:BA14K family protein [Stappia sp.]|uniref:BA14K family protein n=1 Tax=Stappia sp. TaxID=1870903 RepID=UPI0032D93EB9